jgi:hypothetical protein
MVLPSGVAVMGSNSARPSHGQISSCARLIWHLRLRCPSPRALRRRFSSSSAARGGKLTQETDFFLSEANCPSPPVGVGIGAIDRLPIMTNITKGRKVVFKIVPELGSERRSWQPLNCLSIDQFLYCLQIVLLQQLENLCDLFLAYIDITLAKGSEKSFVGINESIEAETKCLKSNWSCIQASCAVTALMSLTILSVCPRYSAPSTCSSSILTGTS